MTRVLLLMSTRTYRSRAFIEAARRLGVARVGFLGYVDSGMAGAPTNADPASFRCADVVTAYEVITTTVDGRNAPGAKRAAVAAHASQIPETPYFLAVPEEAFANAFGQEWYVLRGAPPGTVETDLFASFS